jgi:hypothetical protein
MHYEGMTYGYARVSTDAQDLSNQVAQLKAAGVPNDGSHHRLRSRSPLVRCRRSPSTPTVNPIGKTSNLPDNRRANRPDFRAFEKFRVKYPPTTTNSFATACNLFSWFIRCAAVAFSASSPRQQPSGSFCSIRKGHCRLLSLQRGQRAASGTPRTARASNEARPP